MTNCAAVPVCDLALGVAAGSSEGVWGESQPCKYGFDFTAFSLLWAFV